MQFIRYVCCDNVLREFGARVLALRLACNLSREEVTGLADMPVRSLAKFETGTASLDLICFVRLCLVLGLRDRVPEWMPPLPAEMLGRTQRGPRPRRRAGKRREPAADPYEDPEAYWAQVHWIWEP